MTVIKNNNVVFFDVDDTLIFNPKEGQIYFSFDKVEIEDPLTQGKNINKIIHHPMIRLLLEENAKGSYVIVWSRGGYDWARNVVKALKLETKVNMIITKPMVYFDDLAIEKWLPYRVYFEPGTKYK